MSNIVLGFFLGAIIAGIVFKLYCNNNLKRNLIDAFESEQLAFKTNTDVFLNTDKPLVEYWARDPNDPDSKYMMFAQFDTIDSCEFYGKMSSLLINHNRLDKGEKVEIQLNKEINSANKKYWICKIPQ